MTGLRARVAGRPDGVAPLVVGDRGLRRFADLAGVRPGARIAAGDRIALSLADPMLLIDLLVALDGVAGALLLVSYAQPPQVVADLARAAGCTRIVSDRSDIGPDPESDPGSALAVLTPQAVLAPPASQQPAGAADIAPQVPTAWLMTTSGTTGLPKIVPHTLQSLARTVYRFDAARVPALLAAPLPVWGLLYDPTRFAGLQVVLQALIGGGSLIAADLSRPLAEQVAELARHGCTHLSATPTLWRRLLMVPGIGDLALRQITLGGETVPQDILDALGTVFPAARRTHIYASTEAGVGFAVNDGIAGFPAAFLTAAPGGVRLKIVDGLLWLRPPGKVPQTGGDVPAGGAPAGVPADAEGFICSGDLVRPDAGRVQFLGRENGLINVGGAKVYPEVVERAVGAVPGVRLVKVSAKPSPITGALILAEVLADPGTDAAALKAAIQQHCRAVLPREAVPGVVRLVEDLEMNAAGKLVRRGKGAGHDNSI